MIPQMNVPAYMRTDPPRNEKRIEFEIEVKAPEPDKFAPDWTPDMDEEHKIHVAVPGYNELLYTGTHRVVMYESDVPALQRKVEAHPEILEEARQAFVNSLRDQVTEMLPKGKSEWTDADLQADSEIQGAFHRVMRSHADSVQSHYRDILQRRTRETGAPCPIVRCDKVAEHAPPYGAQAVEAARAGLHYMPQGDSAEVADLKRQVQALTQTVEELTQSRARKGGRPPKTSDG